MLFNKLPHFHQKPQAILDKINNVFGKLLIGMVLNFLQLFRG